MKYALTEAAGKTNSTDWMKTVLRTDRSNRRCRQRYAATPEDEQSRLALPKNIIRPLPVQYHKSERFRRPALPFAGARWRSGWSKLRRQRSSERIVIGSDQLGNRLGFHISVDLKAK